MEANGMKQIDELTQHFIFPHYPSHRCYQCQAYLPSLMLYVEASNVIKGKAIIVAILWIVNHKALL